MVTAKVNGIDIEFTPGMTVLQVCELAGEEIPRFCYHEKLKIAGNCRMCLVKVKPGPPKPAASCALPASDGMEINTKSEMVTKARKGALQFLLSNHPLDCPICDQGGECDLQDQTMKYGADSSDFMFDKRVVDDKNMGPLIETHMTRCIHCTRCVRFMEDIAGTTELGAINRGNDMNISTFLEKSISSEVSGNIIDLCPVGALNSKPYAYSVRSWELKHTNSVDVLDGVGSKIRVDSANNMVMRILPRINDDINEEWIDDKTRFSYDGLRVQRLDVPRIRGAEGILKEVSWEEAFAYIAYNIGKFSSNEIAAIAGKMVDTESAFALISLFKAMNVSNFESRVDKQYFVPHKRESYIFNTKIENIDESDLCLIIGSNLRYEASMVNVRIRKNVLNGLRVFAIGVNSDLTYDYVNLENSPKILEDIKNKSSSNPKLANFISLLENAKNPMIIIGESVLSREDAQEFLNKIFGLSEKYENLWTDDWKGINVLSQSASKVALFDMGFHSDNISYTIYDILQDIHNEKVKFLYSLGADEIDYTSIGKKAFIVYQGHHGDSAAQNASVILPGCAYTEKNGLYANTEGRYQNGFAAISPIGEAKEDWKIIRKLAEYLEISLPFNTIDELRAKYFGTYTHIEETNSPADCIIESAVTQQELDTNLDIEVKQINFYMNNIISKNSSTMAKCVEEFDTNF